MAMKLQVLAALAGAAVVGMGWVGGAHAALLAPQVQSIVSVTAPPGCSTFNQDFSNALRNSLSTTSCTTNGLTGGASARIGLGPLATGDRATVSSSGTVAARDISAVSMNGFLTHVTVGSAALDGEIGYLRFGIDVEGSFNFQNVTPSATAQGAYQVTVRQNNGKSGPDFVGGEDTLRIANALDGSAIDLLVGTVADVDTTFITMLLPFRFGETFALILQSSANVFFDNVSGTNIYADVDFFNTSTVAELLVFDQSENPVTAFTLASTGDLQFPGVPTGKPGSGDATTVPEPGGLLLLAWGVGVGGLGAVRRRRAPG